jgi:transposase
LKAIASPIAGRILTKKKEPPLRRKSLPQFKASVFLGAPIVLYEAMASFVTGTSLINLFGPELVHSDIILADSANEPMAGRWELSDEQCLTVDPVFCGARRADNPGRPWHDARAVLNGVLWKQGTDAPWRELPEKYPPIQACHRPFQQWVRSRKLEEALKRPPARPHEQGKLNLDEAFADAAFASAKKGALRSALPVAARAPRSWLSPLVTVFLSPYPTKALRRPSANLWKMLSRVASSTNSLQGLSATGPATRTRSTKISPANMASSRSLPTGAIVNARIRTHAHSDAIADVTKWIGSLPVCILSVFL